MPARLGSRHAKAILDIMVRDALDEAGKNRLRLIRRAPLSPVQLIKKEQFLNKFDLKARHQVLFRPLPSTLVYRLAHAFMPPAAFMKATSIRRGLSR
jgi:hypothetical protein